MPEMSQLLAGSDFLPCSDTGFPDILYIDLYLKSPDSQFGFSHSSLILRQKKVPLKLQGTHIILDLIIRHKVTKTLH